MIIVLEGLPGAGKTTIAELLAKEYSFGLVEQIVVDVNEIKKQKDFKNPYFINDENKCTLARKMCSKHQHVVVDRNYISTLAFNYAVRNDPEHHSSFTIARKWYLNSFRKKLIPPNLYIYLRSPIKFCFIRKNRKPSPRSPWTNNYCLKKMKHFYENIFPLMEPEVPKISISSKLPIKKVIKIILLQCLE
ncbi:deoxynucleoside kinase [bacterium]|nr:deoxynucleoside kinase [bacterium]